MSLKLPVAASLVLVSFALLPVLPACGGSTVSGTPNVDGGVGTDAGGGGVDGGGGLDAGNVPVDSGVAAKDAGLPAAADVQFDNCPAFTASGGDPVGTWDYTAACVDTSKLADLGAACMGAEKPTIKSATGKVQGRIIFTATQVARNVVTTTNAVVTVAKTCFPAQVQGQPCATLGQLLASQVPGASCGDGADVDHCDCNITIKDGQSGTNGYTKNGTQLMVDDGSVYDFSVSTGAPKTIQYVQTTPAKGAQPEPGISTATLEP
jgi:hypothetical protein